MQGTVQRAYDPFMDWAGVTVQAQTTGETSPVRPVHGWTLVASWVPSARHRREREGIRTCHRHGKSEAGYLGGRVCTVEHHANPLPESIC